LAKQRLSLLERAVSMSDIPPEAVRAMAWESLRAVLVRPAQVAAQGSGVLLLVAIQHFDASPTAKALLAASTFIGMLLSFVPVAIAAATGSPVRTVLAAQLAAAAAALGFAASSDSFLGFFTGVVIGVPLLQSGAPLVTDIWRSLVPDRARGATFGLLSAASGAISIVAMSLVALYMGDDAGRYRPVLLALAVLLAAAAIAAMQIPAHRLEPSRRPPMPELSILWRDRRFGAISAAWMFLGFGNLATVPLRTEYVATDAYGFAYSAGAVLWLTVILPQATELVAGPLWGRAFDRADFLQLRISLNTMFLLSILLFFTPHLILQVAGSIVFGLARGGGFVVWNLWVTKYAAPGRTADYMAVHTFLTGTRGLCAPFLAYAGLAALPLLTVTRIGAGAIVVASVMLALLLMRDGRRA